MRSGGGGFLERRPPESCPQSRADGAHFPSRSVVCRREPARARSKARAGRGRQQAGWGEARAEGGGRTQSSPPGGSSLHQPAGSGSAAGPLPPHPTPAACPPRGPGSSWCGAAASGAPARDRSGKRRGGHLRCTLTSATREQASTPSRSPFVLSPPSAPSPIPSPIPYPATPSLLCPSPLVPAPVPLGSALHTPWATGTPCFPRAIGTLCTPLSPSAPSHRPPGLSLARGSLLPSRVGCASGSRLVMSGWRSGSTSGSRPPPTRVSSR